MMSHDTRPKLINAPESLRLKEEFNTQEHNLELKPGQVHIWSAYLNQPDSYLELLHETLSQDERERAKRFVFEKDRRRFVLCRGILRNILTEYLEGSPESISFMYGLKGKPAVDNPCGDSSLYFNLSHSEDIALYALSRIDEVGVDVEYMRELYGIEQISECIFTQREMEAFRGLPEEKKKEAFFTAWTRKEALLKAIGDGLSISPNYIEVFTGLGKISDVKFVNSNGYKKSEWYILDLKAASGYIGALSVKSCILELSYLEWSLNKHFIN